LVRLARVDEAPQEEVSIQKPYTSTDIPDIGIAMTYKTTANTLRLLSAHQERQARISFTCPCLWRTLQMATQPYMQVAGSSGSCSTRGSASPVRVYDGPYRWQRSRWSPRSWCRGWCRM